MARPTNEQMKDALISAQIEGRWINHYGKWYRITGINKNLRMAVDVVDPDGRADQFSTGYVYALHLLCQLEREPT